MIMREGYVAKNALKQFEAGTLKTLVLYEDKDLHHVFGDNWEEYAVKVVVMVDEVVTVDLAAK